MTEIIQRWVPKVHPATRAVEPDDPMTLFATPVDGDPEFLMECLVEEYSGMGWTAEQILDLFHEPGFPALQELLARFGEAGLRQRVAAIVRQTGVFCFQEYVREA